VSWWGDCSARLTRTGSPDTTDPASGIRSGPRYRTSFVKAAALRFAVLRILESVDRFTGR
jgi:hypothetical protein